MTRDRGEEPFLCGGGGLWEASGFHSGGQAAPRTGTALNC